MRTRMRWHVCTRLSQPTRSLRLPVPPSRSCWADAKMGLGYLCVKVTWSYWLDTNQKRHWKQCSAHLHCLLHPRLSPLISLDTQTQTIQNPFILFLQQPAKGSLSFHLHPPIPLHNSPSSTDGLRVRTGRGGSGSPQVGVSSHSDPHGLDLSFNGEDRTPVANIEPWLPVLQRLY